MPRCSPACDPPGRVRIETFVSTVLCAVAITFASGCYAYHPHGYGCGSCYQGMNGPVFPNQGFPAGGYPPGAVPGGYYQSGPIPNAGTGTPPQTTDTGTFGSPGSLPNRPSDGPFGGEESIDRPRGGGSSGSPSGSKTPRGPRPTIDDDADEFPGGNKSGASTNNSSGAINTAAGDDAINRLTDDTEPVGVGLRGKLGEEEFASPKGGAAKPMAFNDADTSNIVLAGASPRYDFDHVNDYEWVRGKVTFDKSTNEWRVTYHNNNPAEDKLYGGELTLANPRVIADISPGRVYLIEGVVDPDSKDSSGRPTYFISRGWRLRPGSATSNSAADFGSDNDSDADINR